MALKGTPMPRKGQFFAAETSSSWPSSFAKATTLEVTVLSAEEVVIGEQWRRPLDRGAHATVHADWSDSAARTAVNDEKGHCNGYPYWGEALRVTLPAGAKAIHVEIYRTGTFGRQEPVAAARVPVEDFSVGPPGHLHCLSYRLFDTRCGTRSRNGVVNITVKRLDGAPAKVAVPTDEGKGGRALAVEAASGTGGSCSGGAAGERKVPAGAVMGYPVESSSAGQANGKCSV